MIRAQPCISLCICAKIWLSEDSFCISLWPMIILPLCNKRSWLLRVRKINRFWDFHQIRPIIIRIQKFTFRPPWSLTPSRSWNNTLRTIIRILTLLHWAFVAHSVHWSPSRAASGLWPLSALCFPAPVPRIRIWIQNRTVRFKIFCQLPHLCYVIVLEFINIVIIWFSDEDFTC